MKKFFKLDKYNTNIKTEILAGFATFLAMAYVLIVNPNNLLTSGTLDARWPSVFVATAIGAAIGTLLMSLIANKPFAAASTMGINAMTGTVLGGSLGFAFSYGNAMLIIFFSAVLFLLLSIIPVGKKDNKIVTLREKIFDGTPTIIIKAIPVGVGLFIAMIGLKNAGIIGTNFNFIDFTSQSNWVSGGLAWRAIIALFGLIVICVLSHFKVKGAVLIGILSATILAIPTGVADLNILFGNETGITWKFWENIGTFFSSNNSAFLSIFKEGFILPEGSLFTVIILVLTFIMLDLFDTIGTIVGCSTNAGLSDENGKPDDYNKIMWADSLASCIGAVIGTSTVSTYVESGVGIAAGGKTGLTSLTISILFIISIFILPIFAFIPIEAASAALLYVGVLMMKNITDIDFEDIRNAVPSFLTIIIMPLTLSIANGIGVGIISYFVINLLIYIINRIKGNKEKLNISFVTFLIVILFLIYFLVPRIV